MTEPIIGNDFKSDSGREWKWCAVRQCWQLKDYKYRVYPSKADPVDFTCASNEQWHEGVFKTFNDAEKEFMRAECHKAKFGSKKVDP